MSRRLLKALAAVTVIVAVFVIMNPASTPVAAQGATAAKAGPAPKTAWGEPDLQGIWTDEYNVPLQRPAKFATKEFFTDEERAQFDKQRAGLLGRDNFQTVAKGTERDVAGAYNAVFTSVKHTGRRTSLVTDPPDGRIPPLTAQAQKYAQEDRAFRLALLQSTETCKTKEPACSGGKYDPNPSPRWNELSPRYNTARTNRHDNIEDGSLGDRCMSAGMPDFGGFRRIVQTPGGISMFYDVGQGQGWQRNIVMNGTPHVPSVIRQWWGDSRGRWEGNSLVVDVTNFSEKADFRGSRENLHLIERWTRMDANTIEYGVTIEDPTVWTRPWTVKQDLVKQGDNFNRVYYEPRCFEGNYGFPGLLNAARTEDAAYAEGRGPHPSVKDRATDFTGVEDPGGANPLADN